MKLRKILISIFCVLAMISIQTDYAPVIKVKATDTQGTGVETDDIIITKTDLESSQPIQGANLEVICKYDDNSCAASKTTAQDIIANMEETSRNMELVFYITIGIAILRIIVFVLRERLESNIERNRY